MPAEKKRNNNTVPRRCWSAILGKPPMGPEGGGRADFSGPPGADKLGGAGVRGAFLILGQHRDGSPSFLGSIGMVPRAPRGSAATYRAMGPFSHRVAVCGKDGVAASKNWKALGFPPPRGGAKICRKKIDTQKVCVTHGLGRRAEAPGHPYHWGIEPECISKWFPNARKACSTQCSQVVAHLSTNWA